MIECPAARALDLQFGEALGGGEFAVALATADVLHVYVPGAVGQPWSSMSGE